MSTITIAWIGITLAIIWGLILVVFTVRFVNQADVNQPQKITIEGCLTAILSTIGDLLYIPLLIIDFRIEVLIAVITYVGIFCIDSLVKRHRQKIVFAPNNQESKIKPRYWLSFILLTLVNVSLHAAPFIVYLLVR